MDIPFDHSDIEDDCEEAGIADTMMLRGEHLRKLRLLELADEEAREWQEEGEMNANADGSTDTDSMTTMNDHIDYLPNDKCVLRYDSYLRHQRFYDDLKHVDCDYIDFGVIRYRNTSNDDGGGRLIIEQDKSLGKGGLCWDAAFILGEHMINCKDDWNLEATTSIVELGSGTGLCGAMIAKAIPQCNVHLTDLPELMDLMVRNVMLNFDLHNIGFMHTSSNTVVSTTPKDNDSDSSITAKMVYGDGSSTVNDVDTGDDDMKKASGNISASVLRWGEPEDYRNGPYDIILGADVVASLYDPISLAHTIHDLCHDQSSVYISYKGRLTGPHEAFEQKLQQLFSNVLRIKPSKSRNRNSEVWILRATGKRK